MKLSLRKSIVLITLVQFVILSGLAPVANSSMVSTRTLVSQSAQQETREALSALLVRDDVRQKLESMGVDPEIVDARLASLTPAELTRLQKHMDEMPAGAGALEVIGIVFLVLLILELVGVTNIFTRL